MDKLQYKGFSGSIEKDEERNVWRGRILSVDDLVTYEADLHEQIESEFRTAVDDYIETSRALGR